MARVDDNLSTVGYHYCVFCISLGAAFFIDNFKIEANTRLKNLYYRQSY
ncbi:hypothetical protein DSUL_20329 [Desulfovibrionales bacterium]